MLSFPTTFTKPQAVKKGISPAADAAIDFLAQRGFVVLAGIDEALAESISQLATETHIRKYCPRDYSAKRFANIASTKAWLSSGHSVFVLVKRSKNNHWRAVGYGWSGPKKTAEVPGGETTFALRIGQAGLGQHLSAPFSQVVLDASAKLYDAQKFWLETWASNQAAVHVYKKLGFSLVNQKPAKRPRPDGTDVDDTRLYMSSFDSY